MPPNLLRSELSGQAARHYTGGKIEDSKKVYSPVFLTPFRHVPIACDSMFDQMPR